MPCSLSVSDKLLPVWNERNYQSTDTATTNKPNIHVCFVLFTSARKKLVNTSILPQQTSQLCMNTSFCNECSRGNDLLIVIVTIGQLVRIFLLLAAKIYSCNKNVNNFDLKISCY